MLSQFQSHSRIKTLALMCIAVMAVFGIRLFYLQVVQHDKYVTLADNEQIKRLLLPAKRGEIYMMDDGTPEKVVLNDTVYTMFVDPKVAKDKEKSIAAISRVAGGNTVPNFAELFDKSDTRYQIIAKKVTRKQAELIKKSDLSGVGFQEESQRVYPEKTLGSQVLGFVNTEGKGQYGVEGALDDELKGQNGLLQSVTDVSNVPLTIGNRNVNQPAKNGKNVVLSVDRNIQWYTENALKSGLEKIGAPKGSAIVMDPQTGKVLAMANYPTYNPGKYGSVTDAQAFNNATITTPYEPGSVMKTFTVAAGLDTDTITPGTTFNNTDYVKIGDRTITNATKGQTGNVSMQHALTWSLNTGMVNIAQRMGDGSITSDARNKLYEYYNDRLRLGQATGIQLAGESRGILEKPNTGRGDAVRYSNMTFGQGMDVTMLQVAAGFSAIVNGGIYHTPTVIDGTIGDNGEYEADAAKGSERVLKESTSSTERAMIIKARQAFYAGNDKKGYSVGGKTGTSQAIINGKYTFDQTIGTYLGFGGDTKPRYVIMVQVSGDNMELNGGDHALPIFTDISNWMIDYKKLQPKG